MTHHYCSLQCHMIFRNQSNILIIMSCAASCFIISCDTFSLNIKLKRAALFQNIFSNNRSRYYPFYTSFLDKSIHFFFFTLIKCTDPKLLNSIVYCYKISILIKQLFLTFYSKYPPQKKSQVPENMKQFQHA